MRSRGFFSKVTGILLKPREFDTVLIPLVCNKQRIFIRDSFHKRTYKKTKNLTIEERLFSGLSLLSFKALALRQISTFAFEKDLLKWFIFSYCRLLGFIGPVPPPAQDKRVSVQLRIISYWVTMSMYFLEISSSKNGKNTV